MLPTFAILSASALLVRRKMKQMDPVWSFGFGSNMDVSFVENKKGHKVLDNKAGVVHGWKMSFNLQGMSFVEPAFANAVPAAPQDNIHGVAILLSPLDVRKLQEQERGYDIHWVNVECYDGSTVKAFIFSRPPKESDTAFPLEKQLPSRRYLNILLNGAKAAGLQKEYLVRLEKQPIYTPNNAVVQKRKVLLNPTHLKSISMTELWQTRAVSIGTTKEENGTEKNEPGEFAYTSIFGYVLKLPRKKVWFKSHLGRDLTARFSRHYNGISMDKNDDLGKPPYPSLKEMNPLQMEYIMQWMDFYLSREPEIVGYLTEFLKEQDVWKEMDCLIDRAQKAFAAL